jgi:hypothetical protein
LTIVCIRQPGYLPFSGFFKKIQTSDIFVLLDDVQFEKNDWDNRNKIRTSEGNMWLTVPILHKFGQKLNEIKIANNQEWSKKHLKSIQINYQKAPFFNTYWDEIRNILNKEWDNLIDLNYEFIKYFVSKLNIKNKILKSSELKIDSDGSEKLLKICKKLKADTYLSGELGKNYLDENIFNKEKIKIVYEKYEHPTYNQIYKPFLPNMSIIDLLFNEGGKSLSIIKNSKNF